MKISFVIPAYNEEDRIAKCLDSICAQAKKYPGLTEIIVVNNASTDRTKEIASRYAAVKVVDEFEKGLVQARRAGFLFSSGDLIANIDADTFLTPGWLDTVFREFALNPKLVGLSGPFKYHDLPKRFNVVVSIFYRIGYVSYLLNRFVLRVGSMLQGGNFIVTRVGLEEIGGYDTSIGLYGEDVDIARRLNSAGDVKFTFKLPIYASGRRVAKEGLFTTGFRYGATYLSMIFLKRPIYKSHVDIRLKEDGLLTHVPANKKHELITAAVTLTIATLILGTLVTALYYVGTRAVFPALIVNEAKAVTKKLGAKVGNNISRISKKTKNSLENTFKKLDTD